MKMIGLCSCVGMMFVLSAAGLEWDDAKLEWRRQG